MESGMDNPLFILAFLSLFHILGGGALGMAFRGIRDGSRGCRDNVFFIIWGSLFGGIPLLIGASFPGLLLVQVFVLLAAFFTAFFFWDRIRDMLNKPGIMITLFGGIFFIAGCAALGVLLNIGEFGMSVIFGLVFCGLGGFLVFVGLKKLLGPPESSDDV